jgi:hypothetical protein
MKKSRNWRQNRVRVKREKGRLHKRKKLAWRRRRITLWEWARHALRIEKKEKKSISE